MSETAFPPLHQVDFYLGAHGDPQDTYRRLRREAPVHWHALEDGRGMWFLSRWEDIRSVSRQPRRFTTSRGVLVNEQLPRAGTGQATYAPRAETIIHMDPPRHGRIRNLVSHVFTPRRVADLEPWMREICREHFGAQPIGEPIDLVTEIAAPVPAITIARLLGVPPERWRHFQECANAMIEVAAGDPDRLAPKPEHLALLGELSVYLRDLIEARRGEPRDDLLSALVHVELEGERFDADDVLMMALTLLGAGNETTRTLVSRACLALHQHPAQWEALRAAPDRLKDAVEEFLRWVTPVHSHTRTALQDTEIRGRKIAAGDCLVLFYAAANRDEAVWEDGDRFDVRRPAEANPHLSLGHGEHFCLGASLARLEARVIFEELLAHFAGFELAGEPVPLRSNHINGMESMPVVLTRA